MGGGGGSGGGGGGCGGDNDDGADEDHVQNMDCDHHSEYSNYHPLN